jgi:hypothetical protein
MVKDTHKIAGEGKEKADAAVTGIGVNSRFKVLLKLF